ncbi:hypothetical protein EVAR_18649_1 [Eumeta japonica]|uniref:Uncharacterized protein n=1 Tax=Eumeta variegata TaxID=151549 RepID=A0A4C1U6W9_EUMVA|nr:hypothetical protein EVAR_18649_1 [Eumeta japonica]
MLSSDSAVFCSDPAFLFFSNGTTALDPSTDPAVDIDYGFMQVVVQERISGRYSISTQEAGNALVLCSCECPWVAMNRLLSGDLQAFMSLKYVIKHVMMCYV